jgi:predicted ATPase
MSLHSEACGDREIDPTHPSCGREWQAFLGGAEAEREIAFAALLGLTRQTTAFFDQIPAPQAAALRGAIGLGPPISDGRFLIAGAVLSLFAAIAEREPLLVLIDDLQWIDEPSTDALLFAARRLCADRVATIFTSRRRTARQTSSAALS